MYMYSIINLHGVPIAVEPLLQSTDCLYCTHTSSAAAAAACAAAAATVERCKHAGRSERRLHSTAGSATDAMSCIHSQIAVSMQPAPAV